MWIIKEKKIVFGHLNILHIQIDNTLGRFIFFLLHIYITGQFTLFLSVLNLAFPLSLCRKGFRIWFRIFASSTFSLSKGHSFDECYLYEALKHNFLSRKITKEFFFSTIDTSWNNKKGHDDDDDNGQKKKLFSVWIGQRMENKYKHI